MTPEQLSAEQRAFLIRTEKRSAVLMLAEFETLKKEISNYLLSTLPGEISLAKIEERNFLARFLDKLTAEIDKLSFPLALRVASAQKRVINFASNSLKRFLPEIKTSVFETDKEAIQKLINRAQRGESLQKAFSRLAEPLALKAKQELIEGFSLGEPVREIARRIDNVSEVGLTRALTVARTETVMAYRNASVEYFEQAGIEEYRFMSVLDVRTCLICWALHGTKWKTRQKPNIHVNCRCCILPVTKNTKDVETGISRFEKLETGYQRQILGASRFNLYAGGQSLESLVGVKASQEFGQFHFIRPLSDFE